MAKAAILDKSKKVLEFVGPAQMPAPEAAMPELTVGGRRYRLVPVEPPEAVEDALPAVELLTPRELQIVALVAAGNVNKQVADVLRISEWTVSTHLRRIYAKLGVDTRAAMVSRCFGAIGFKASSM